MSARREFKTVLIAAVLAVLAAVAAAPWLGPGWIRDYLQIVTNYDKLHLDPAFVWSLKAEQMSNLRGLLHVDLGLPDDVAVRISTSFWLASLAAVVVASTCWSMTRTVAWPLCLLSFLLLCPHLSPTEDVALFCVLQVLDAENEPSTLRLGVIALVPMALWLSPAFGPAKGIRPSLLFLAKVVILVYVLGTRVAPAVSTALQRAGSEPRSR
jgi:hypothetical protein